MKMLRVFMGEKDHHKGIPMHEYILKLCYQKGIAGATVFHGIMGYGRKRHIHRSDFFSLSGDLPIVIEIIDKKENIALIRDEISQLPFDGLMIEKEVEVTFVNKLN